MLKRKRLIKIFLLLVIGLPILWIGLRTLDEMAGSHGNKAETLDDYWNIPTSLCPKLSADLCRLARDCSSKYTSNKNCSGDFCTAEFDVSYTGCEAMSEEQIAERQKTIDLCKNTGGDISSASDIKYHPDCYCGTNENAEFFTDGKRDYYMNFGQKDYGCTTAKHICDDFYQGTWTPSTLVATTLLPDVSEILCYTAIIGNSEPVKVWNSTTQQCEALIYEPRFPTCTNSFGNVVSRGGGF
ncbi:MAG: hypothetical protein ACD_72C00472G0002 [uncultured bacterium]|nr:MAG: hypothetical protein ACD_72C00472G0002 [uncultured bacterium]